MTSVHESTVEYNTEGLFERLGYQTMRGADVDDAGERAGPASAILEARLRGAVERLNPHLSPDVVAQVIRTVATPPHPTLEQNNRWLHGLYTDGVEVEYRDTRSGERRGGRARLIDFDTPSANDWLVVRQLTIVGPSGRPIRPDLVVFLNGLPVGVIELKDPADEAATLGSAVRQFERYKRTVPDLFAPNVALAVSDGLLTRIGSLTAGADRFMPWRPEHGGTPALQALVEGPFAPERFLDYLQHCIVFEEDERGDITKKIAGYHQFRAVRKARASVLESLQQPLRMVAEPSEMAGRGGVVWHTQGSGKSLTMLMLAGALIREPAMENPTIVMVTDRNDLDDQLFETFAGGRDLLRQMPVQAESREHLKELLDRASGGVIFTTIHKFTEEYGLVSDRWNVVVMADEAHRSQYGFVEGGARWMRVALPNATFVGFTGTPLERDDKNTIHVFGPYSDVYDIRQAVEDGATKPLYYESRIVKLSVDEAAASEIEETLREAAEASAQGEDAEESVRVPLEALVGAQERVERLAAFIIEHWEKRRAAMEGKAMVVTMSRDIAARLYEEIRKLRPAWHDDDDGRGAMKVVMTGSAADQDPVRQHVRTKAQRKRLAARFKDPADDFRLAIVVDMWLTGFDVPPAHTMYLDKPLAGHNLMQAIAASTVCMATSPADSSSTSSVLPISWPMHSPPTRRPAAPVRRFARCRTRPSPPCRPPSRSCNRSSTNAITRRRSDAASTTCFRSICRLSTTSSARTTAGNGSGRWSRNGRPPLPSPFRVRRPRPSSGIWRSFSASRR